MPVLPKPSTCFTPTPCPLALLDKNGYSEPEGTGINKVMLIGEALGANERRDGKPFREDAEAGGLLERLLRKGGWDRQQFVLNNIVRCQPPSNKLDGMDYEQEAIEHCKGHFDRVVERFKPSCLLALGNIPLRTLTGMAGDKQGITMLRGFVLHSTRYNLPVVASFHPSYINRGNKYLSGVLIREIGLAIDVAALTQEEVAEHRREEEDTRYILKPSIDEAFQWAEMAINSHLPITVDTETPYTTVEEEDDKLELDAPGQFITSIQFSVGTHSGIFMPFTGPFLPIIARLLASVNEKWWWNGYNFDIPLLRKAGMIIGGEQHDLMNAWHHVQPDLPKNLQFVTSFYAPWMQPWKHLAHKDPTVYGVKDVDAPYRIGLGVFHDLKQRGLYDSYMKYYVRYQPILEATAARGIPVDREQQANLKGELEIKMADIDTKARPLVPVSCQPVKLSPKLGYKKVPKGLPIHEVGVFSDGATSALLDNKLYIFRPEVMRWFRKEVEEFNLNSSQQLIKYIEYMGSDISPLPIAKRKLYKVPTKRGTGKKTVEEEQLQRLYNKTNDTVLGLALERKKMSHFVSAFCSPYWTPREGGDGRIHTLYKVGGTAVMQLSAEKPNVLQFPKHGPLAQTARRFIVAPPGYKIVTHDFKAFHAQTGSCEAGDALYLRLAKLDIHSYVTARFLHVPGVETFLGLTDKELLETLTNLRKDEKFAFVRDAKAKHAILGINNGMGADKLYDKYQEFFTNQKEAKDLHSLLRVIFPVFFGWQTDVRKEAHANGYLLTRFGCIRYFWEVFKRVNGQWRSGESSEECIAYRLSNHAHCHMRDRVIEMDDKGLLERYGLINIIHDECVFLCRDELVEECLREIPLIMSRPSEVMIHPIVAPNGLSIEVDSAVGQNWSKYHAERNPEGMRGV